MMTTLDVVVFLATIAVSSALGTLLLLEIAEQLRRGRWPWLLNLLARRKWK